jgi:hypothetical protein
LRSHRHAILCTADLPSSRSLVWSTPTIGILASISLKSEPRINILAIRASASIASFRRLRPEPRPDRELDDACVVAAFVLGEPFESFGLVDGDAVSAVLIHRDEDFTSDFHRCSPRLPLASLAHKVVPLLHVNSCYHKKKRRRGRPVTTGKGLQIGMRWHEPLLGMIDDWAAAQDDEPSRTEAIRRLVERGLAAERPSSRKRKGTPA